MSATTRESCSRCDASRPAKRPTCAISSGVTTARPSRTPVTESTYDSLLATVWDASVRGRETSSGRGHLLESSRELERDGDGWFLQDLGLNRYGRRRYEFALDVRVPGIEPYTVRDSFRVPRRVENTWFSRANKLEVGLELRSP